MEWMLPPACFNPQADARPGEGYGPYDNELGVALTRNGPASFQWFGSDKQLWQGSKYAVVRDEASKRTFYEVQIPFVYLHISPKAGTVFGFNFVLFHDNEGAGETYCYQNTPGVVTSKTPFYFAKFVLSE